MQTAEVAGFQHPRIPVESLYSSERVDLAAKNPCENCIILRQYLSAQQLMFSVDRMSHRFHPFPILSSVPSGLLKNFGPQA